MSMNKNTEFAPYAFFPGLSSLLLLSSIEAFYSAPTLLSAFGISNLYKTAGKGKFDVGCNLYSLDGR
jgi:hypothetical protein